MTAPATPSAPESAAPARGASPLTRLMRSRESGALIAFLLMFLLLAITRRYSFLSYLNLSSLAAQITFNAISGIGVLFVLITSGVDLSLGSAAGLSGFVCAMAVALTGDPHAALFTGMAAAILTGVVVGAANGAVIAYLRVTPFVVTLGMMWIARSVIYILGRQVVATHAERFAPGQGSQASAMPVTAIPQPFIDAAAGSFAGIPVPVLVLAVLAVIAHVVLAHTVFGRRLYAIGGNEEATRLSGIEVRRIKLLAYVACSAICGITGFLYVARFSSGTLDAGKNDELQAIAAAVIGGTSLMGGSGSVPGVILGACVMGIVSNGMDMFGLSAEPKLGIFGAVIITAAVLDVLRSRGRAR